MSYNLDIENFITEVHKHPELWNKNSENHKYMHKRFTAWNQVAQAFIPDFDEMSTAEKKDIYKKLQGKWRNLRDSYVRFTRGRGGKNYAYAKHLAFLDERYKTLDDSEVDHAQENDSSDNEIKKEEVDPNWSDDDIPLRSAKRKKKESVIEYVEANTDPFFNAEDEDKSFFDSLLPAVRDLNIDQKLEFRSEVLKLVKQIRKGMTIYCTE